MLPEQFHQHLSLCLWKAHSYSNSGFPAVISLMLGMLTVGIFTEKKKTQWDFLLKTKRHYCTMGEAWLFVHPDVTWLVLG